MSLMFKFSQEMLFFESRDAGVFKDNRNKLFASNEKQIDNHTLMLYMLYSYMSVVCTERCLYKDFWVRLLIFEAKKAIKGTELQFLCTKHPLRWKSQRP